MNSGSRDIECVHACRVNGQAIREAGFEVHAAYGAAVAHECAVAGLSEAGDHTCGAATELRVVPAGKHATGRAFLGTEVVHAHLTGAAPIPASTLLLQGLLIITSCLIT